MATVVFSLPDNLAEFAQEKGVFKSEWFETITRNALIKLAEEDPCPPGFKRRWLSAVDPDMYDKGSVNGDIIGPFHEECAAK